MIYPRPCTTCKVSKHAEAFRFENKAKGRRKARRAADYIERGGSGFFGGTHDAEQL